jgi:hypothetical protein
MKRTRTSSVKRHSNWYGSRQLANWLGLTRAGRAFLTGVAFWLLFGGNAAAHEIRPAIMDAFVGQNTITLIVRTAIEPLIAEIDLGTLQDTSALDLPGKSSGLTAHARQPFSRKPMGFSRQGMNAACVGYRTH